MKAFILAAGNGTRLRPLTENKPKCLLPIRGTPLLGIWLERCLAAGIEEVLVNVHAQPDKMRSFIRSYDSRMRVHLAEEQVLLGSAGTLAANRSFVEGEKSFLILYADVLTTAPLDQLISFHESQRMPATIGVHRVPDPERCGIVGFDRDGVVRRFVEKPSAPSSNWAFSGMMVASPSILDKIPENRPADIGFHLLPQLVGRMTAYPISEFLLDIGTAERYQAAQSLWPGLADGIS